MLDLGCVRTMEALCILQRATCPVEVHCAEVMAATAWSQRQCRKGPCGAMRYDSPKWSVPHGMHEWWTTPHRDLPLHNFAGPLQAGQGTGRIRHCVAVRVGRLGLRGRGGGQGEGRKCGEGGRRRMHAL